jgi:DNA-binding MarR family transcriptional regulator
MAARAAAPRRDNGAMPRPSARPTTATVAPPAPAAAAGQPAPVDPPVFQLLNEVGILSQLSGNLAGRLLAPGLNLSQFTLLNHFARLGGERSLVQLASAMQVTKAAMTNTVARLQAKGLLQVRPDPADGRGKLVGLTEAGLAARQAAVLQLGQGLAPLAAVAGAGELQQALAVLRQLRQWFDQNR